MPHALVKQKRSRMKQAGTGLPDMRRATSSPPLPLPAELHLDHTLHSSGHLCASIMRATWVLLLVCAALASVQGESLHCSPLPFQSAVLCRQQAAPPASCRQRLAPSCSQLLQPSSPPDSTAPTCLQASSS